MFFEVGSDSDYSLASVILTPSLEVRYRSVAVSAYPGSAYLWLTNQGVLGTRASPSSGNAGSASIRCAHHLTPSSLLIAISGTPEPAHDSRCHPAPVVPALAGRVRMRACCKSLLIQYRHTTLAIHHHQPVYTGAPMKMTLFDVS